MYLVKVLRIVGRCVHFKLGDGCAGIMSLRHVAVDEDLADEDVVAKSYPIGNSYSQHTYSLIPKR
jgi:hypothetical protein